MKSFLTTICLICTLALTASPAFAEVLKIVTIALPPYGYVENNQPMGLNYELGNIIAEDAGYTPENIIVPLARAVEDIQNGNADVVIMFPNPTIETSAENLGLVLPMETVLFGRADAVFRSLRDVRGKTVATVRGAKYDDRISKKNGIILYPTESYSQSLKMLLAKRVDAVVGPMLGLSFTAKNNHIPKHALGKPLVLSVAQGSLFLSRTHSTHDMKRRLTESIKRLKENGTINALLGKYTL